MHQEYEQERGLGMESHIWFCFNKNKDKQNTQSDLNLENIGKLAFWLNGDVKINI